MHCYEFTFGNLAIMISKYGDFRPMALRRRLSPGLPFTSFFESSMEHRANQ
jgi:hypothetical protein